MKTNTINKKEIEKFSRIAEEWWDPSGKFKPLHKFNPIRIKYIKDNLIEHFKLQKNNKPLKNLQLLDIGCGGGLLSEPMSRLGANVVGIDASLNNIKVAKHHLKKSKSNIKYFNCSPENLKTSKKFDVILNMEVIEHVSDLNLFIKSTSSLLNKKGIMFIATINKTFKSYLFAIIGAEYVLNWLPIGTHDWFKFVEPKNLQEICERYNLKQIKLDGLKYNLIQHNWKISNDTSINYISIFKKL